MSVARGDGFKDRVVQGELRLGAEILEQLRQRGHGIALRIGPAPDHHQSLRRYHLAVDALRPMGDFVTYPAESG
jgi:hypothetical protein